MFKHLSYSYGFQTNYRISGGLVAAPDNMVVSSAAVEDDDWEEEDVQAAPHRVVRGREEKDGALRYVVLVAVHEELVRDEEDELGDDDDKVGGELVEGEEVPAVAATKHGLAPW